MKPGPTVGRGFESELEAMFDQDLFGQGQTQALPLRFGAEERAKEIALSLEIEATTIVEETLNEEHLGSDFDDFLREDGLLDEAEAVASKGVLAYEIAQAMERQKLTKSAMARKMGTSRSSLDRLLDPGVPSVTLLTIEKAARVLGKKMRIEMVEAKA